ncbi:MAG: hypothetical protein KJ548_01240 [Actinobacteria bacterium]|nr:hypothetical protein [Actinomycetota bacterium]
MPDTVGDLICSARRCGEVATHGLLWNNPKLHTPERRKVWLACPEHVEQLSEYLQVRSFLRDVVEVETLVRDEPAGVDQR